MRSGASSFPILSGEPVTERHVKMCQRSGHAAHRVDGVLAGICPRCGDVVDAQLVDDEGSASYSRTSFDPFDGFPYPS